MTQVLPTIISVIVYINMLPRSQFGNEALG